MAEKVPLRQEAGLRYAKIRELLNSLRPDGGDGVVSLTDEDELAQIEAEVRLIGEELTRLRQNASQTEARLHAFSAMLAALVSFNLSYRLEISEKGDVFDGFAYSLNILAEELAGTAVSREYFDNILQSMPDAVLVTEPTGQIRMANRALCLLCEYSEEDLRGQDFQRVLTQITADDIVAKGQIWIAESTCRTHRGTELIVSLSASVIKNKMDELQGMVFVLRDLTESRRLEAERWHLRESMQRQAILLEELSTPIIPITDEVVVVPLIGSLDQDRFKQMSETLLKGVLALRARVTILDLTGVRQIDQEAIRGLLSMVRGLMLLGTSIILSGIRPELAVALVNLGNDLKGVQTVSSLQSGIQHALRYVEARNASTARGRPSTPFLPGPERTQTRNQK